MDFYLSALNISVQQSVLLLTRLTLRDTIQTSLFLDQLNTLFFFRNGNYHFKYNNFILGLLEAAKALTVTSNLALDIDAVTYLAGGNPLTDFVNVDAWIANFDVKFAERIAYLDTMLQSFDCENGTDVELNGSGAFRFFNTTNLKNLAYTVAKAASWSPPNNWINDTSYPIVFPPGTRFHFFANCTFSPSSVRPIKYKISIAFYFVVYKNGNDKNVPIDTTWYEVGDTLTVLNNDNMIAPPNTVFLGWAIENDLSNIYLPNQTFGIGEALSKGVRLHAVWGAIFMIRYFTNGADQEDFTQEYRTSSGSVLVHIASNVTKNGYGFVGWSTNNSDLFNTILFSSNDLSMKTVTSSMDLYAALATETTITLSYHTNGAVTSDYTQSFTTLTGNVTAYLPDTLTKYGFTFLGWSLDASNPAANVTHPLNTLSQSKLFSLDTELYAAWSVNYYTLTYDKVSASANGTVPVDLESYTIGQAFLVADQGSLSLEGYTFNGWVTDLSLPSETVVLPITERYHFGDDDIVLYAWWMSTAETTYTITYTNTTPDVLNDPPVDPTLYPIGSTVILLDQGTMTASVNGLFFVGWELKGTLLSSYTLTITENITLRAVWNREVYTVTYVNNTSSIVAEVPVDSTTYNSIDNEVILQAMVTVTTPNYLLSGWTLENDLSGEVFRIGTSFFLSSNVTFYAVWEVAFYVTFTSTFPNSTGAAEYPSRLYPNGLGLDIYAGIGTLAVAGYSFDGWSLNSDLSEPLYPQNFAFDIVQNLTFYANWIPS
jgi:hypothetical protein